MTPLKRFFLLFFGVYLAGMIVLDVMFGPPGMSKEFMADPHTRAEYEHYLEIVKSEPYKRWRQNPQLNPADATPHLPEDIAFVQQFEQREDFQHETHRREWYKLTVDMLHVSMMVLLLVKLARRPLVRFLDQGIERVRIRIAQAEAARQEALARRAAAEQDISRLGHEKTKVEQEGRRLVEQDLAQIELNTSQSLAYVRDAAEDRKREEEQAAAVRLREELVTLAVQRIVARFESTASPQAHERLLAQFVDEVENLR